MKHFRYEPESKLPSANFFALSLKYGAKLLAGPRDKVGEVKARLGLRGEGEVQNVRATDCVYTTEVSRIFDWLIQNEFHVWEKGYLMHLRQNYLLFFGIY